MKDNVLKFTAYTYASEAGCITVLSLVSCCKVYPLCAPFPRLLLLCCNGQCQLPSAAKFS
jgi:hypothetical protein